MLVLSQLWIILKWISPWEVHILFYFCVFKLIFPSHRRNSGQCFRVWTCILTVLTLIFRPFFKTDLFRPFRPFFWNHKWFPKCGLLLRRFLHFPGVFKTKSWILYWDGLNIMMFTGEDPFFSRICLLRYLRNFLFYLKKYFAFTIYTAFYKLYSLMHFTPT